MLGVIEGNAAGVTGWDIANVFPGGGGNWGGSYLTVPTQSEHQAEAKKLAGWLTAPEQQIKAFTAKGTFPSQKEALESSELLGETNAFFNDAPTGRSSPSVPRPSTVTPFKGTEVLRHQRRHAAGAHPRGRRQDGRRRLLLGEVRHRREVPVSHDHHGPGQAPERRSMSQRRRTAATSVRRLAFSQQVSKWDVKLSPYLYISPFFILFAITGLFPLLYTALGLAARLGPHRRAGKFVGPGELRLRAGAALLLEGRCATRSASSCSPPSPRSSSRLVIAAVLDANLRAKTFWRMGVLVPFVVAPVAVGLIFNKLFADQFGLINEILKTLGLDPVRWHAESLASHTAIATMVNFRWTGYNTLIFLAAMQAIPRDLFEAAIDRRRRPAAAVLLGHRSACCARP